MTFEILCSLSNICMGNSISQVKHSMTSSNDQVARLWVEMISLYKQTKGTLNSPGSCFHVGMHLRESV